MMELVQSIYFGIIVRKGIQGVVYTMVPRPSVTITADGFREDKGEGTDVRHGIETRSFAN